MSIAPIHDRHKKCFAYCGDDRCNCPARNAYGLLGRVSTALPVLSTMLRKIGANGGADLATEMQAEVEAASKPASHPSQITGEQ
ncbi:hypothetical protein [Sphingopyxis sp. PET50]|uniref:hypothetical protein n=1 Tax=Sphingopyxis sp. PET50 TaxID=2976533 RepID=UPI0021B06381|nr:hypothetical protein [Sphingopyxis sp. PET50]